jgi:ectoine hydroxylase-related dioxygenase (phytanoyl-CoA dioxygenase family)
VVEGERFDHGGDQPLHCDFGVNNIAHPSDEQLDTVSVIVFLDDSDVTCGHLGVVPGDNDFVRGIWPLPRHQTPSSMPGLHEREWGVSSRPGTALFYRHDTWHRGSEVKPRHLRRTIAIVF